MSRAMNMILRLAAPLLLAACVSAPPPAGGILAVGDSVMAWNGGAGVPETVGAGLGLPVRDAARSGARVSGRGTGIGAAIPSVGEQWTRNRGAWDWVLVNGGANDLRPACGTAAEGAALNALITPALGGPIPALVRDIRATGSRVVLMGYYANPRGARTGFTACRPILVRLDARLARLAARDPGVTFVDSEGAIDPADRGHYAGDLIHPSATGSARIGALLASAMR